MSEKYWDGEWPNLNSVSITINPSALALSPEELGIFYRLLWFVASKSVHSAYSEPSDIAGLPNNDERICRIACCSYAQWVSAKPNVLTFFDFKSGVWVPRDEELIRISKPGRLSIQTDVKNIAAIRDGGRCVYCGDTDGPFHLDHLWPVSRGGTNDASNIVTACASCNLSKGSKTLREWMCGDEK